MTTSTGNQPKHLYPLKIALRTQRLIQGTMFYDIFVDMATGQYVRNVPNAEGKIKDLLIKSGWSEETYEISWNCFESYLKEFQSPVFQHAVYSIISHWDWYISNLGKFIIFAENQISPNSRLEKDLLKLSFKSFQKQIQIIINATGISFSLDSKTIDLIEEMHLVRNLGMHNQWEVDDAYLRLTKTQKFKNGEKRTLNIAELTEWYSAFLQLVGVLSTEIAIRYARIPNYDV